jgi:serine/threonine-protein kinase
MSPEQLRSLKNVDTRTDIWSLGVILYMLLTGRRPYEGESMTAICAAIVSEVPPSVGELRPEVPPALDALVHRCLEKDLERRVQSVAELARGLAPFGSPAAQFSMERVIKVLPGAPEAKDPCLDGAASGPIPRARGAGAEAKPAPQGAGLGAEDTTEPATGGESSWGQTRTVPRRKTTVAIGAVAALAIGGAAAAFFLRSAPAAAPASPSFTGLPAPTPPATAAPTASAGSPAPAAPTKLDPTASASVSAAPPAPATAAAKPAAVPKPAAAPKPSATAAPTAKPADPMERWN